MRVHFGWSFDSGAWPELADGGRASLGAPVLGPAGFLSLLETRLGIAGPAAGPPVRIAQYLARLRAIDDGTRYWSEPLAADGWATARLMLRRRDELIAGGWNGRAIPDGGGTVLDLAAAEGQTDLPLSEGPADRLQAVLAALDGRDRPVEPPIGSLTLLTPAALLPAGWRSLVERLAGLGVRVEAAAPPVAAAGGRDDDASRLAGWAADGVPPAFQGDGTVTVLECDDESLAAELAAGWLAADRDANDGLVILRGAGTTLLDAACARMGLPRPGGLTASPLRGVLQVLPLAFETAWAPFDPFRLLEFLTLPFGPIPAGVASRFAQALAEEPGVGGPLWQEAWRDGISRRRAALIERKGLSEEMAAKRLKKEEAAWRDWLEPVRFDPADGMPAIEAGRICARVQAWALRWGGGADPLVNAAAGQAGALAEAIAAARLPRLTRPQLERMVDAVVGEGLAVPEGGAEAAAWTALSHPGQVWGAVPSLLWWGFTDPVPPSLFSPWRDQERAALAMAGCRLEPADGALRRETHAWRQPFRHLRGPALLVLPRAVGGTAVAAHPLWHEIGKALRRGGCVVPAAAALKSGIVTLARRTVERTPVPRHPVPAPRRIWTVRPALIGARETESASSLEKLLGCAFNWVLTYQGRIRPGALGGIADGDRRLGLLAHAVIAELYRDRRHRTPAEAREAAAALYDRLVPVVAAPRNLPGRSLDRRRGRSGVADAAYALAEKLTAAGLQVVDREAARSRPFDGGTSFSGRADLVLADRQGRPAILDLKWTSSDRRYKEALEQGLAVQLAAYSWLFGTEDGPAASAYFLLRQRHLMAASPIGFPTGTHVPGSEDLAGLWNTVRLAARTVLDRLRRGVAVATGVGEPEECELPDAPLILAPPCRFCDYRGLCISPEV